MTTKNENKEVKNMTSTEELMNESALAEQELQKAEERDRINTRLCYERALNKFYEEEGINPEEEKSKKELIEQKQKQLDEMSIGQEIKYHVNEFKKDWKNPVKRKILTGKGLSILVSIFRFVILFGLCFIILLPLIQKLSFALRDPMDLKNPQIIWIPDNWSVKNIVIAYTVLTDTGPTFWNTILLSVISMVIQVMATALPAYAFARLKCPVVSNLVFYAVLISLAIPNEALRVSTYLHITYTKFFGISLIGNVLSLYIKTLFGMGIRSAIFIYLFRQAFRNLPKELEESAEIDGAGTIRTFWSVMLPNVRGTMITVALFAFVWQYNDYFFADLFGYGDKRPLLTTALAGFAQGFQAAVNTSFPALYKEYESLIMGGQFGEYVLQTAALLIMLPLLIMYLFVQRKFVESVERSGLTGM